MTQSVSFDFSRIATLSHLLGNTAVFNATTELGRARVTVGAGDAATRVAAPSLGAWANGITYGVAPMGGATSRLELDGRNVRVGKSSGATANDVAALINSNPRNPRNFYPFPRADNQTEAARGSHPGQGAQGAYTMLGADVSTGSGADPAATGSGTLAGGADPDIYTSNSAQFSASAGNGGLFIFDNEEPLVLVQFMAALSASAAWALTLRRITPARADTGVGLPIANATAQTVLVSNQPVIIPPGWALGFSAVAVQGAAFAMVRRA